MKELFLIIPLLFVMGCLHEKPVDPVVIEVPIVASDGCCEAGRTCASGVGVTKEYCENELDGNYSATGACNDAGKCE